MKSRHRSKLSVTIDSRLERAVTRFAQQERIPRSRVIEEALLVWERQRRDRLAKEGYGKMAAEDRRDAEAYLLADIGEDLGVQT